MRKPSNTKRKIMYRFLFIILLFISCNQKENNSKLNQNLNAVKSKMMMDELEKYLKRADEVTNNEVKEFHVIFYQDENECLFEINYENHSYNLENLELNDGHLNIDGKTFFFHGLSLSCTKDFVDSNLLSKEKISLKRHNKDYWHNDDLFQLFLLTGKGKLRRLAKA